MAQEKTREGIRAAQAGMLVNLLLAAANTLGGYLGSRTATRRGTGFVRAVFLVVVSALVVRLGWDVWAEHVRG